MTGAVRENGEPDGGLVGLAIDDRGRLLVTGCVGNAVWRVSAASPGR